MGMSRTGSRLAAGIALLGLGVAALTACSSPQEDPEPTSSVAPGDSSWEEVVAAAKEEGEVVFYTVQAEAVMVALADAFEEEYGIKVTLFRSVESDMQVKLEADIQTGSNTADVIASSDLPFITAKADELKFVEPVGPSFENPDLDLEGVNVAPGVFTYAATVVSYAWNTELHPDGLDDFDDLLDPALGGSRVGIAHPQTSIAYMDFYLYLQDRFGEDFLEKLAAQKPRLYNSAAALVEALASGEISAASHASQAPLFAAQAAGAPVEGGVADPAWAAPLHTAVMPAGPNPNAAQVFIDFMFSPAGQEIISEGIASVLPDTESAITSYDRTASGGAQPEDFEEFMREFNSMFQ